MHQSEINLTYSYRAVTVLSHSYRTKLMISVGFVSPSWSDESRWSSWCVTLTHSHWLCHLMLYFLSHSSLTRCNCWRPKNSLRLRRPSDCRVRVSYGRLRHLSWCSVEVAHFEKVGTNCASLAWTGVAKEEGWKKNLCRLLRHIIFCFQFQISTLAWCLRHFLTLKQLDVQTGDEGHFDYRFLPATDPASLVSWRWR